MEITCKNRWQPISVGHMLRVAQKKKKKKKFSTLRVWEVGAQAIRLVVLEMLHGVAEPLEWPLCIRDMWNGSENGQRVKVSGDTGRNASEEKYRTEAKCWRTENDAGRPPQGARRCADTALCVHQHSPVNIREAKSPLYSVYFGRMLANNSKRSAIV